MNNYHKYLAITSREEAWGFYVTTAGYCKTYPNEAYPRSREHPLRHSFTWSKGRILNDYYLVFISKGRGVFESAQSERSVVSAGSCFFLFPGIWHRYKPDPASGWEEYWIGFKGAYPEELMKKDFFSATCPIIRPGLNDTVLTLIRKILAHIRTGKAGYHQVIAGIALQLLGWVHTLALNKDKGQDMDGQLVEQAKFFLREHLEAPLDMHRLLKGLPVSYSKFRKMFKQSTGQSPNRYHLNLRLETARELLGSTNLYVSEVAYQLGFGSVFYFSKLFKKKYGVSPNTYRSASELKDEEAGDIDDTLTIV